MPEVTALSPQGPTLVARRFDAEILISTTLLLVVLAVGLATARDYGVTNDEFNTDVYGPRALDWYLSGFRDRAVLSYEEMAWYGPWAQMLIAAAQKLGLAAPFTVRHAVNFMIGLAGIAALVPLARLTAGRWAGLLAVCLCLITGYLYGQLFFTPIDVPFLAAMVWAALAVVVTIQRPMPRWRATIATGVLAGLALGTRTGGVIVLVYAFVGFGLCALALALEHRLTGRALLRLLVRFAAIVVVAGVVAYALWPWLQAGDPFTQFMIAYTHFAKIQLPMEFPSWGRTLSTAALPWHYIAEQLLARLPELFVVLLAVALVAGLMRAAALLRTRNWRQIAHAFAGARGLLIVAMAALAPPALIVIQRMAHYDGIRHVLFIIPMLAVLASWGARQIAPWLLRFPKLTAAVAGLQVAAALVVMVALHPLEYVATNAFAGGLGWSYGRFELDTWTAASEEAVRRLARLLPAEARPRVITCMPWREHEMGKIYPPNWIVETDPGKADYLIETERYRCAQGRHVELVDEVRRLGKTFAWTYRRLP